MNALSNFFYMSGYGSYVFTAYGAVLTLLGLQWFLSWRRWHHYLKTQTKTS